MAETLLCPARAAENGVEDAADADDVGSDEDGGDRYSFHHHVIFVSSSSSSRLSALSSASAASSNPASRDHRCCQMALPSPPRPSSSSPPAPAPAPSPTPSLNVSVFISIISSKHGHLRLYILSALAANSMPCAMFRFREDQALHSANFLERAQKSPEDIL